jgi:hypothetical protein
MKLAFDIEFGLPAEGDSVKRRQGGKVPLRGTMLLYDAPLL